MRENIFNIVMGIILAIFILPNFLIAATNVYYEGKED